MIQQLTPAQYHAIGRKGPISEWMLSKSMLFDFAKSPYAWKYRLDKGERKEVTESMEWGTAIDTLATSPDEFASVVQFVDAATWIGKAAQEQRQAIRASGKVPMLEKDRGRVQQAAEMLFHHFCRHGLNKAQKQVAATSTWTGASGRVYTLKCLADFWQPLADLKTTRSLDAKALKYTIADFGYHWQAAMYADCFRANGQEVPEEFPLHFQEASEPFRTRVWHITPNDIAAGRREYLAALEAWDFAVSTDTWGSTEMEPIENRNAIYTTETP